MTDKDKLLESPAPDAKAEVAKQPEIKAEVQKEPEVKTEVVKEPERKVEVAKEEEKDVEPKRPIATPEVEFHDDTAGRKVTRKTTSTLRSTWWRFLFLALCCLVLVGSYFCYDNPAPVESKIKTVRISTIE